MIVRGCEMVGTGPAAATARVHWRRVALAAAPWAVAGVLGALGLARAGAAAPAVADASPGEVATSAPPTAPDGASAVVAHATPTQALDAAATWGLPADLLLAVLRAGHAGLVGAPTATDPAVPERWPVDLRVAAVTPVDADLAVATVHGLVIDRGPAGWSPPRAAAHGVPVRLGARPAVLGPGWPLPRPDLPSAAPEGVPVADPDPAVVDVLVEAGWRVHEVTAVELVAGTLLRVRLTGAAPDDDAVLPHEVWLLDAPGGPRLAPGLDADPEPPTTNDEETP